MLTFATPLGSRFRPPDQFQAHRTTELFVMPTRKKSRKAAKRKTDNVASSGMLPRPVLPPLHTTVPRRVSRTWKETPCPQPLVPVSSPSSDHPPVSGNENRVHTAVTIMTYNILAQTYVSSKIFPASPSTVLRAANRRKRVIEDIRQHVHQYQVDVLCLQELEQDTLGAIIQELPEQYGVAYKLRTSSGTKQKRDGSAVLWRKSRFECLFDRDAFHLELNDIAYDERLVCLFEDPTAAKRDCVSALVCLQDREAGHRFIVSSSHLFWDPEYPLIKLAQAFRIREAAFALAAEAGTKNIVLAGDWNSMPDSCVFALLQNGRVAMTYPDCADLGASQTLAVNQGPNGYLRSVYVYEPSAADADADTSAGAQVEPGGGDDEAVLRKTVEEPLTTLTHNFMGALDHIFLSVGVDEANAPTALLSLPVKSDFAKKHITALPSEGHPSDHLPLVARISLALDNDLKRCGCPSLGQGGTCRECSSDGSVAGGFTELTANYSFPYSCVLQ